MKLGMTVGKILIFIGVILLFCALYIANIYGMGGTTYVYFGMSLGTIALGTICYEVGKCSDALEKFEKFSTSALKAFQDILTELRKAKSGQDSKEVHVMSEEKNVQSVVLRSQMMPQNALTVGKPQSGDGSDTVLLVKPPTYRGLFLYLL